MLWNNKKGTYGYIKRQRRWEITKTVLMFAISISLYVAGYIATKTNKNLLTLAAVLGCLPASRSAVSMFMFFRAKGCSVQLREAIGDRAAGLSERYDLYLTSYAKNFPISHAAMCGKEMAAITEQADFDEKACYQHLRTMFSQNGFRDVKVEIFRDREKYLERLDSMRRAETAQDLAFEGEVLELMENLAL